MICYYRTTDDRLEQINLPEEGCWVSVTAPCEAELEQLSREFAIELDDIKAPLDDDERARIQVEDSYTMILVDMPVIEKRAEGDWYGTMPLSIIITDKMIFTVCLEESPVITHFLSMKQRSFHTRMKTRFILQILYKNSSLYLQYLRSINRISEGVEKMLRHSTKNEELIKLLDLEKSLVYFTTSLRSNE
ncbi:MAG: magnesium transporter CorA family protein, partial [Oscillospiraceae bacterium]